MKVSVLINNYNYQDYVLEAIESVLTQSVKVDEIVVVDDCSTDGSASLLREKYSSSDKVQLILKEQNEGQLSAFQAGFAAATGEIICFLDADDLYYPTYVESVLNFYRDHQACDFLLLSVELFGDENRISANYAAQQCVDGSYRDLGYSKLRTLYKRVWIGERTSALSMRRHVLEQFLPIPYLADWRTRADDCLVYGASLAGARKYFLAQPLVKYRVHGSNGHYGRSKHRSAEYFQQYEQGVERLFAYWIEKFGYSDDLGAQIHTEFRSIPTPTESELKIAKEIAQATDASKLKKVSQRMSIYFHFFWSGDRADVRALIKRTLTHFLRVRLRMKLS